MINVSLTEEEAGHAIIQLSGRADEFHKMMIDAGKAGRTERVLQCATIEKTLQETVKKLYDAGGKSPY